MQHQYLRSLRAFLYVSLHIVRFRVFVQFRLQNILDLRDHFPEVLNNCFVVVENDIDHKGFFSSSLGDCTSDRNQVWNADCRELLFHALKGEHELHKVVAVLHLQV